jgi:myo-inositol-1-phosphate synthase
VIDALRCAKLALNNGISGSLLAPSSYFMKSPPEQYHDDLARDRVAEFVGIYGRPATVTTLPAEPAAASPGD